MKNRNVPRGTVDAYKDFGGKKKMKAKATKAKDEIKKKDSITLVRLSFLALVAFGLLFEGITILFSGSVSYFESTIYSVLNVLFAIYVLYGFHNKKREVSLYKKLTQIKCEMII